MFDTVLVADRGLVACRVVRTCQRLGIRTVTVHSAADASRLHVALADESLLLGADDPATTYLDGLKVIEAAGQSGAQAVHPGRSPLAASTAFASAVQDAGLAWVGPPPAALAAGEQGAPADAAMAVTVLARTAGAAVALAETAPAGGLTACPAPLSPEARSRAWAAAVAAVDSAGLVGVVRVLLDQAAGVVALRPWLDLDSLDVELVTGLDLVELQLLLAAGREPPPEVPPQGAAVLLALRACSAGSVGRLQLPDGDGLRVESGVRTGDDVPAGEVVLALAAWGDTDSRARERLAAAREDLVVDGIELEEHL